MSNSLAARMLSLHLTMEHSIFGLFDTEVFISGLVEKDTSNCTAFEVNTILALASVSVRIPSLESNSKLIRFSNITPQIHLLQYCLAMISGPKLHGCGPRSVKRTTQTTLPIWLAWYICFSSTVVIESAGQLTMSTSST